MLISIIGAPCSGKTTAAARAFAALKEQGFLAEFINEQARVYIAQKRFQLKLKPEDQLTLCDEDQVAIMTMQSRMEETFLGVCSPDTIIISDSSPLSALLYMSPEARAFPDVQELVQASIKNNALFFHTKPLPAFQADPNRIHDRDFSLAFDQKVPQLLQDLGLPPASILETSFQREELAVQILQHRFG